MKHRCFKCMRIAVWRYMPGKDVPSDYYCDDHIRRGCSCNLMWFDDKETDEPYRDEQGRELPCCEYDYDENGFDDG